MKYAYVRVSTIEQNESRQVEGLKKYEPDEWFIEKCSGKNTDRAELQRLLDTIKPGDIVYIHDFSRLSRSTEDLLRMVAKLNNMDVHLVSNKENIDTSTPTGKLMLTMIAAINDFERTNMLERQREGIAIAKKNGVYKGSKPKEYDKKLFNKLFQKYTDGNITKVDFAIQLGVSRPTLDKILRSQSA